jgi:serine/threonine-protein kinase
VPDAIATALADALRDRYLLERELGQGGMATVWLARDLKHDRLVAIKVLRPELWAATGPERFLQEVRLTATLQHPHILPLFDSGRAADTAFYVMPFVDGENLRDRLRHEGQLPLDAVRRIAGETARALAHAHDRGVIHRDIKPENILLARDGTVLVADFGVARALGAGQPHLTETGMAIGTPAYMSPEQAAGDTAVDARSDQYSLACVVYEMVAGEPPFTGPNPQAIVAKRLTEPVPRLGASRDVPHSFGAAVHRALARAPADRFPTVAAFASALEDSAGVSATTAAPIRSRPRARSWRLLAAGAIALVGLATVGTVLARRPRPATDLVPGRVVIAPFDNRTGDPALDQVGIMAAEWLTQGLSSTPLVDVVDSRSLVASVRSVRESGSRGDPALALARETRAGTVVAGSVYRVGDSLRFQARVADAASGRLRLSMDPVTSPLADPVAALEPLRRRVTGALASLLDDRLNNPGVAASRPPSYEAYQEYMRGMENYGRDTRADIEHFDRAVSLDSGYAQALLWLGIAHADAGEIETADSIFTLAEARRDQMAPYDQANLDYFAPGFVRGDWEASYAGARRMLELGPSADHAKWAVALTASNTHRPREVLAMLSRIDTTIGWGRTWRFGVSRLAANALHDLGDYAGELALASRLSDVPEARVGSFMGIRARALVGLGRVDEVAALPLEAVSGEAGEPGVVLLLTAAELSAHGHAVESRRMYQRAATWYRDRATQDPVGRWRDGQAYALLGAEAWVEARELYAMLAKQDTASVTIAGALGVIAARTGQRGDAERALRLLASSSPIHLYGEADWWRGRILAILGRTDEAADAILASYRRGRAEDYRENLPIGGDHSYHLSEPELLPLREDHRIKELFRPKG